MHTFNEIDEEHNGSYSRPLIDRYLLRTFWGPLTHGLHPLAIKDFEEAQWQLDEYKRMYDVMKYTAELYDFSHLLQLRMNT